jgi:RimJ/RimL family protein N-acetyltransferase
MVSEPNPVETERLLLEQWDDRRRAAWRAIARDPAVMRFVGPGEPWEAEHADEVFARGPEGH